MKRVLLIPHDDRPPNLQFPKLIGRIAGLRVLTPPRRLLGSCGIPGDVPAAEEWAESRVESCQVAAVSLNFTTSGGLVASRKAEVSTQPALRRLDILREIRRRAPECEVLAFGSITKSRGVKESPREHIRARRRNLECFRRAVELVADGVIDYLALGQDDAEPGGEHTAERDAIWARAEELGVSESVTITCGTDESAMLLLARAADTGLGREPTFKVEYSPRETAGLVPLFEDQPVSDTIAGQIRCAGGRLAENSRSADCLVHVLGPEGVQRDVLQPGQSGATTKRDSRTLSEAAERALESGGKLVGACDIVTANGGTPGLLDTMRGMIADNRLHAYAGWNTSANTTGTVIAHLCALLTWEAGTPSHRQAEAHAEFLNARLIDDILYQGVLRRKLADAGPGRVDKRMLAARDVAEELEGAAFSRPSEHCVPGPHCLSLARFDARWPWKRAFEIEVSLSYGAHRARSASRASR